jgi:hypothetical protein
MAPVVMKSLAIRATSPLSFKRFDRSVRHDIQSAQAALGGY